MTVPWLASASLSSPKTALNFATSTIAGFKGSREDDKKASTEDAGSSCALANAISSEIHGVRSAIEARFKPGHTPTSATHQRTPSKESLEQAKEEYYKEEFNKERNFDKAQPQKTAPLARQPRTHRNYPPLPASPRHPGLPSSPRHPPQSPGPYWPHSPAYPASPAYPRSPAPKTADPKLAFAPRTADPRLAPAQYEFRLPDSRSQHKSTRREKRYGLHYGQGPPPKYDEPRSAIPAAFNSGRRTPPYHTSRTPGSPRGGNGWPREKTPTSPRGYHPRRSPGSPKYGHPAVPHTAHPGGSFPRFGDSPREKSGTPDSAKDNASGNKKGFGFLESFEKVKAVLSPNSASANKPQFTNVTELNENMAKDGDGIASPPYSPIPPPNHRTIISPIPPVGDDKKGYDFDGSKSARYDDYSKGARYDDYPKSSRDYPRSARDYPKSARDDTRQHGFYEYRTPHHQHFPHREYSPRTPNGERLAEDYSFDVPDDESKYDDQKYDDTLPEEPEKPKTLKEKFQYLIAKIRLWFAMKLQRPRSRIPSVQPDLEQQTLEEVEKEMREAFVLSWTCVIGAWLVQFTTFGYIWSFGVFQDFYLFNFPEVHTSAPRVAWIGSLQLMLTFAFGILSGKLFDAGWFHFTMMLGSLIFGMGLFALSFVDPTKYIHLFLVQGLMMGTGVGLVFVPSALVVQLHFPERKAFMTGIVMSGSSFGAMIYPIMLDKLLPSRGFGGAVRASSYMVVAFLVIANCLMTIPSKKWTPRFPPVNLLSYMKEIHYAAACGAIFLVFLTMWFPQYYIEEFAVKHGVNSDVAFYSLCLIALGGMVGRVGLGFAADRFGPWTMLLPTTFVIALMVCLVVVVKNVAAVVMISLIYGVASGAWLSLLISALSSLALRQGELGHRVGFALSIGSMGAFLTGSAQAGLLSDKWVWARPVGFFAFLLIASIGIMGYIRHLVSLKRRFAYV